MRVGRENKGKPTCIFKNTKCGIRILHLKAHISFCNLFNALLGFEL